MVEYQDKSHSGNEKHSRISTRKSLTIRKIRIGYYSLFLKGLGYLPESNTKRENEQNEIINNTGELNFFSKYSLITAA